MDLTMVQFNTLFKEKMNEAKLIEKTRRREAEKTWFQLTLFMINFAKSPNCPRTLRKQLIYQADTIVKKIKLIRAGIIQSVVDSNISAKELDRMVSSLSEQAPSTRTSIESTPSQSMNSVPNFNNEDDEETMASQLQSFPDVPEDLLNSNPEFSDEAESKNNIPDPKPKSDIPSDQPPEVPKNPFFMPGSPKSASSSPSQPSSSAFSDISSPSSSLKKDEQDKNSDFQKLTSLEDELKKMPDIMKEVKPTPFSNQSIITPVSKQDPSEDLRMYKKETTTLDVTKTSQESDSEPTIPPKNSSSENSTNLKITGFTPQPFQKTNPSSDSSPSHVPDPFGPQSIAGETSISSTDLSNDTDTEENHFCFACGGELIPGDKICPLCGTENF